MKATKKFSAKSPILKDLQIVEVVVYGGECQQKVLICFQK